jgi:hypothetical protein
MPIIGTTIPIKRILLIFKDKNFLIVNFGSNWSDKYTLLR